MAVIWGLDLGDMKWSSFKSKNMFDPRYHLRRTKMLVYQWAMIFCVVSESVGTAALSDYVDQQDFVSHLSKHLGIEYNDDFVGIASYNIFVGIAVATIFGAAFFFDLFWPERHESKSVRLAWKICACLMCVFVLGDALALTIIVARHSASISGIDAGEAYRILQRFKSGSPLKYNHNPRAVASVVCLWIGLVGTYVSTYILFKSHIHDDEYGPKSKYGRELDMEKQQEVDGSSVGVGAEAR